MASPRSLTSRLADARAAAVHDRADQDARRLDRQIQAARAEFEAAVTRARRGEDVTFVFEADEPKDGRRAGYVRTRLR